MSDYTKGTNFAAKDALPSGNSAKRILGTELDAEFTAIQAAVNSKADESNPTFTGVIDGVDADLSGDLDVGGRVVIAGETTVNGGRLAVAETGTPMVELHDVGTAAMAISTDGTESLRVHTTDGSGALGTKLMSIDTSGRASFPLQPAFRVYRSTDQTSGATVLFDTEVLDRGNCYNPANGRFTAPADGIYAFTVTLTVDNLTAGIAAQGMSITKNGTAIVLPTSEVPAGSVRAFSFSAIFDMVAGDWAAVDFPCTATIKIVGPNAYNSVFSGCKIA